MEMIEFCPNCDDGAMIDGKCAACGYEDDVKLAALLRRIAKMAREIADLESRVHDLERGAEL